MNNFTNCFDNIYDIYIKNNNIDSININKYIENLN